VIAAAEQGSERELVMVGHAWRYADLCELGDIVAAKRELDACEREAQGAGALRAPAPLRPRRCASPYTAGRPPGCGPH
jgi:hypothetical protein